MFDAAPPAKIWLPPKTSITRSAPELYQALLPGIAPLVGRSGNPSLKQALDSRGLSSAAKMILDAGDSASYSSGQTWADRSGGGYNVFLGTTSASEASDPTFNGVAGRLSSFEYFSSDGGDVFTLNQTNPTWANNLHKDGCQWAAAGWVYLPTASDFSCLFGTQGNTVTNAGVRFRCEAAGQHYNLSLGSNQTTFTSVLSYPLSQWFFMACSINENGGSAGGIFRCNGTSEIFDPNYSGPTTSPANSTFQLLAKGGGNQALQAGGRIAMFVLWEGAAISDAMLASVYNATRGRFGL